MLFWRIWAILLGSSLMIGELIRSWGQGRHPLFILDDFFIGIPLIITAILMAQPTIARRCGFSAAFAAAAGMLYGSFFGKLVDLSRPASSNIEIGFLTALIGLAFFSSLLGLVASLRIKEPS
ncbi:MAG: hypothetical protein AAF512_22435 [Pseudomonadota bacterium]